MPVRVRVALVLGSLLLGGCSSEPDQGSAAPAPSIPPSAIASLTPPLNASAGPSTAAPTPGASQPAAPRTTPAPSAASAAPRPSGSTAARPGPVPTQLRPGPNLSAPPSRPPRPIVVPVPSSRRTIGGTDRELEVAFRGGRVSGDTGRVRVGLGQNVLIAVTSDVADEVHLHGYDRRVNVPAGGTVVLEFAATVPGVFEVELEGRKRQLLSLQIQ